jgi:hypothetical protein
MFGAVERALEALPNADSGEEADRERIIYLKKLIEAAIQKKHLRIEQANSALAEGNLPGVLATYHDVERAPLPSGIVWKRIRLQQGNEVPLLSQSKFGWVSDLPAHVSWPKKDEGALLSFLCQLNLSELEFDVPLPKSGTLFFFYDAEEQPWGLSVEGKADGKVMYCNEPAVERSFSPDALMPPVVFDERSIKAELEDTVPGPSPIADFDLYNMRVLTSYNIERSTMKEITDTDNNMGFPCPCCDTLDALSEQGGFDICETCGWEDDPLQSSEPDYEGGANILSLNKAKAAWTVTSASDERLSTSSGDSV